jgi:dTDP-4-dehydrorhamnose reductase
MGGRILITGAMGMLGVAVRSELDRIGYEYIATRSSNESGGVECMDIRDWENVRRVIREHKPTLVIHLAAETDVDLCEKDPDHAYATNALGTENVAWACREQGAVMAYISTANVFDGEKKEPYIEFDRPNSINVYGRSKWEGERVVEQVLERHFIFRAGWMVGGWEIDKKFVYKIIQLCQTEDKLQVVNDKFGSPTFTVDFAANLMSVIASERYGLYHLANRGTASRFDIACQIVKNLGLEGEIEITPVSSSEFPTPATRPRSEMMRNFKLERLNLDKMPHWKDSLLCYIRENRSHWKRERR